MTDLRLLLLGLLLMPLAAVAVSDVTNDRSNTGLKVAQAEPERPRATPANPLTDEIERLRDTRERLETELATERATVTELRKQLSEKTATNTIANTAGVVDRIWRSSRYILAGLALALLLGMLIGCWLTDYQQRRRHGGFRL